MPHIVTGSPVQPMVDAMKARMDADATLMALVSGVYGHVSEAARVAYDYIVIGPRQKTNAEAVIEDVVTVELSVWSDGKGALRVERILSRLEVLFAGQTLTLSGFTMFTHSMTCEFSHVFDEPDEDKPGSRLYRGIQRWRARVSESD